MNFFTEIDSWRTVQLAHDDTLGAVDDEFPAADHAWQFSEEDLFLDRFSLFLHPKADLEGCAVAQLELTTFIDRVARPPEVISQVSQGDGAVVTFDRKYLTKNRFQTDIIPVGPMHIGLQEL